MAVRRAGERRGLVGWRGGSWRGGRSGGGRGGGGACGRGEKERAKEIVCVNE